MHGERRRKPIRDSVKCWELIADNLSKAGWSWGSVSGVDSRGRIIFVADGYRDGNPRFNCARGRKADGVCRTRIGGSEFNPRGWGLY